MEDFILYRFLINEFYVNCENKELFERKICDVLFVIVNLFDKIKIYVYNCMRFVSNLIDIEVLYCKNGLININLESIFDLFLFCWFYIFVLLFDLNFCEFYLKVKVKIFGYYVVCIDIVCYIF